MLCSYDHQSETRTGTLTKQDVRERERDFHYKSNAVSVSLLKKKDLLCDGRPNMGAEEERNTHKHTKQNDQKQREGGRAKKNTVNFEVQLKRTMILNKRNLFGFN